METKTDYNSLSRKDKRMAILKDNLMLLKTNKIKPIAWSYFEAVDKDLEDFSVKEELIKAESPVCKVCMMGSLFAAHIYNANEFTFSEAFLVESYDYCRILPFTNNELRLLETIFMGHTAYGYWFFCLNEELCFEFSEEFINNFEVFVKENYNQSYGDLMELLLTELIANDSNLSCFFDFNFKINKNDQEILNRIKDYFSECVNE